MAACCMPNKDAPMAWPEPGPESGSGPALLRVGVWMEYFPDWLVGLGRDGISRLIGYVVTGAAEAAAGQARTATAPAPATAAGIGPVRFEFWGPSFAQEALQRFVADLPPAARALCRVAPAAQADPFAGAESVTAMLQRPLLPLPAEVRAEVDFALKLVTGGATDIYADGAYERNTRTDFVLTAMAANRADSVDVWYVPSTRFAHALLLMRPQVLSFPDYVFCEFPRLYHGEYSAALAQERHVVETLAQRVLDRAGAVITLSEHVRHAHIGGHFRYPPDRIAVIRHGRVELAGGPDMPSGSGADPRAGHARAITAWLHDQARGLGPEPQAGTPAAALHAGRRLLLSWMAALDWAATPFVFFPTVLRPYKNIGNVIEAVRRMRDIHGHPCRLVTTADLWGAPEGAELAAVLRREEMMFDVLTLPKVPDAVLHALYALADAAIAPSLFEGGLPFMVSEALAVDTPVILGDIPVVREVMGDRVRDFPFFDPFDPAAIAACIMTASDRARADRAGLVAEQRALFAPVVRRSWADAACDYDRVFRAVAAGSGHDRDHGRAGREENPR